MAGFSPIAFPYPTPSQNPFLQFLNPFTIAHNARPLPQHASRTLALLEGRAGVTPVHSRVPPQYLSSPRILEHARRL